MMKRIGILTFHRAENFGAALQCYALQEYLKSEGFITEIIDYRNTAIESGYKYFRRHRVSVLSDLKIFITSLITLPAAYCKKKKYRLFRNRFLNCSPMMQSGAEFQNRFDYIICGSDQIWNLRLTGGYDSTYFLDFDTTAKKISYAASSEAKDYKLLLPYLPAIKKSFAGYSALSVREKSFASFLKERASIDSTIVCDPTFLQDKAFYMRIMTAPAIQKFILVYHLVESEEATVSARYLAKKTGLKIIEIHAGIRPRLTTKSSIQDIGPLQLLGYIHNASYIITTSFHGLALSIILEKQFYVIKRGPNQRLMDALDQLGISDRAVDRIDELTEIEILEYEKIRPALSRMIATGKEYLNKSFSQ